MVCGCGKDTCRQCERERSPRGAGEGGGADEMEVVKEAGGLAALLEKASIQQQKIVDESNRKLFAEIMENADKKAEARVAASEEKLRKEFAAMTVGFQGELAKLSEAVKEVKTNGEKHTGGIPNSTTPPQPIPVSGISHRIGGMGKPKSFREKDPGVLQFSGKDAIDKSQAFKVIVETLSALGIDKSGFSIGGQGRTNRFSVKFKAGIENHSRPQDAADHVMSDFAPSVRGGKWKAVQFKRQGDDEPVEFGFYKDSSSTQVVKEVVIKHIYNSIKDKSGADAFKMYKRDGTLFQGFKPVARVIVGFKEDTFKVNWQDAGAIEKLGITTKDIDQELRSVYAKWCL